MASSKVVEQPVKFVQEFYIKDIETGEKILESKWHYDLKKTPYGPVLVENFILPKKEKKKRISKK